jgi:hypothetical protein
MLQGTFCSSRSCERSIYRLNGVDEFVARDFAAAVNVDRSKQAPDVPLG